MLGNPPFGGPAMSSERIQLGQFVLDVGRYELTRDGKAIHVEPIPLDLLILLVRERGRLIGREEIIERLWGKGVFFDTDNGINTAIRKIRRALEEDSENPRYIETVPGKGYRFKGGTELSQAGGETPRIMLAVLPFENLSGDAAQEYFSDGLTEETIMRFGKMSPESLGVIARTSSMAYKRTDKTVLQIGQELGVHYVLEGSVRRQAERVRVTAQLIRVHDQVQLWAQNFDCPSQNVLDIHSEVGAAIAEQVKLELTPEEKLRLRSGQNVEQEAHDFYLRGRFHWAKSTYPEMQKAAEYFRKATQRDLGYALAFSGLADTLMILPINSDVPPKSIFPEAKAAIATALELDPESAEAHNSDATSKFWFDWDFSGAEAAARRAIRLNPSYSLAYLYLAHVLSNTARHEEALVVIRKARMLDPFSLITNAMYGQFLYQAGEVENSIEQFAANIEMESRFWVTHICLAKAYARQGRYDEALASCDRAREFSGGNSEAVSLAGYVHAVSGERGKAKGKLQELVEQKAKAYVPPYNLALVCAGLGETEAAIEYLQEAFEDRDVRMTFLLDYKWDKMRSNERFQHLALRAGF
jgi:TolB-like protein/Flp pilus assembly protein TadD